jgi:uncharacterized protein
MTDHAAVDVVRALYRAFEDQDHDAIRACLADDVRWRQAATAVPAAGRSVTGPDEVLERVIVPLERDWDGFTERVEEVHEADDCVVVTGAYAGTHRATARSVEAEFCHLWWVADGRVRAFRQFTDTAAFSAAVERHPPQVS